MAIRILTYNIHGLPWIHCPIEAIFLWVYVKSRADIVCLQEVFSKKLKEKVLHLGQKYNFQVFFPPSEPRCLGRPFLGFHTPSGLCILVREGIPIVREPKFVHFHSKSGLDALVNKGVLSVGIFVHSKEVQIYNTHFQADFNEIPCCSIQYKEIRKAQEAQLYMNVCTDPFPIICGDFNKNEFFYFERFDSSDRITFPPTGEHLDHLLLLRHCLPHIKEKRTHYFSDVVFSDHIPVLFEFTL